MDSKLEPHRTGFDIINQRDSKEFHRHPKIRGKGCVSTDMYGYIRQRHVSPATLRISSDDSKQSALVKGRMQSDKHFQPIRDMGIEEAAVGVADHDKHRSTAYCLIRLKPSASGKDGVCDWLVAYTRRPCYIQKTAP